jgi:hypothetical protein
MDLSNDESAMFDPDQLMLDELDRRQDLEKATGKAAAVTIDLQDRGPLYQYVMERREDAARALGALVDIDPKEAVDIALLQQIVREYVRACQWIRGSLDDAAHAEKMIAEEFGTPDDPDSEIFDE